MTDPSAAPTKSPTGRLAALVVLVIIGLALFFTLAPRTPSVAKPADSESGSTS